MEGDNFPWNNSKAFLETPEVIQNQAKSIEETTRLFHLRVAAWPRCSLEKVHRLACDILPHSDVTKRKRSNLCERISHRNQAHSAGPTQRH